ncbi:hypothetical protein MP228_007644 [Amoeboaphelidium protococcarum]|nr:hypothetical protein MP228_007644 [Amoeboaphelidium protococcarum]
MSKESDTQPIVNKDPYGIKRFISGGIGGMCLVLVGQPFDTVKVRLQTDSQYKGAMDVVRKTIAKEGIRGLYRGMATPLIFVTPMYAVCFWGYEMGRKLSVKLWNSKPADPLTLSQVSFAGGFSAVPTTFLMTPIERIKVILQTQGSSTAGSSAVVLKGPGDVVKHLMKTGGVSSLYRGFGATLLRDVPGSVAYFATYEIAKEKLSKKSADGQLDKAAILFSGGLAGVMNWAIAIPPDVLKSRLQSAPEGMYKGLDDVFFKLIREEGVTALFKGFGPIMLRAFPANAATFFGAEMSNKALEKLF